jgi:hypothetical protein
VAGWRGRSASSKVFLTVSSAVICGCRWRFRLAAAGDHAAARAAAVEAIEIGDRHHDRDLGALARALAGRASIRQGRLSEGLPMLDEAMVAVSSRDVSPIVTGLVYCEAISACQQSHALDRGARMDRGAQRVVRSSAAVGAVCRGVSCSSF